MATTHTLAGEATIPSSTQAIVLFDGGCPLCRRAVSILERIDWLKRLQFQDCRIVEKLPHCTIPLDPKLLLEQMHLVTPNRDKVYAGFAAFRWMAWRLPLTLVLAPFLYLPGARWLGNKLYRWVARNRYHLVPCKDGVCTLPRGRKET